MEQMRQLLRDPSIPAWVNAITVVVLAGITWWYARISKRQAKAAESQARAALKQAEVAERQLTILQSQIQEQAGIAAARLKENVAELQQATAHWFNRMKVWGQLTPQNGIDLLPVDWSVSIEHARRISPEMYQELLSLQRSSRHAALLIDQFSSKPSLYRPEAEAEEIKKLLSEIMDRCEGVGKPDSN
jgi:hypothetical protein